MRGQIGPEWWHHHGTKLSSAELVDDPLAVRAAASAASFTIDVMKYKKKSMVRFRYRVGQWGDRQADLMLHGTDGIIVTEWPDWLVFAFCLEGFLDGQGAFAEMCREYAIDRASNSEWLFGQYNHTTPSKYVGWYGSDKFLIASKPLGAFASQKFFFRVGRFLNIPGPGIGHDGDPNISIELSDHLVEPVSQFVRRYLALKAAE